MKIANVKIEYNPWLIKVSLSFSFHTSLMLKLWVLLVFLKLLILFENLCDVQRLRLSPKDFNLCDHKQRYKTIQFKKTG